MQKIDDTDLISLDIFILFYYIRTMVSKSQEI